jgi:hypothetical protein
VMHDRLAELAGYMRELQSQTDFGAQLQSPLSVVEAVRARLESGRP